MRLMEKHRHRYDLPADEDVTALCIYCGCTRYQATFFTRHGREPASYYPPIAPPKQAPIADAQLIKRAFKLVTDIRAKWEGKNFLNSYGFVDKDGEVKEYLQQACYAVISGSDLSNYRYFVDYANQGESVKAKELASSVLGLKYINYCINDSPWAASVLSKDPEFVASHGMVCDMKYPVRMIIQACNSIRYLYEFPKIVRRWGHLTDYTDGSVAMLLAHVLGDRKAKGDGYVWIRTMTGGGHSWYSDHMFDKQAFCRFVTGRPRTDKGLGAPMYEQSLFRNTCALWGNKEVLREDRLSQSIPGMEKTEVRSVWGVVCAVNEITSKQVEGVRAAIERIKL